MAVATQVVARFTADISDVQSKMSMARSAFASVGEAASFSSQRIAEVGQTMADAGRKMTVGITLPLGGVAAAASTAAISFEASMNKIVGLVGIASDEVARMGTEVTNMAGQIGKSPDELANGLFVVTSAGLRGSDAMATLANSAKAGAAGLGETNDIARAVAGALSAYGTEVLSASDATDAIVATARAGNFETSQFAAAIGRVLPFAKQAGASFQEMGGAVALLTRVNGDAAQSVTQIQALFRAFVVPTEEAKTALDEVGMSAQDLRDSIAAKGLPATLQMLDKALGGNREQLGRLLGSSEAASAAFQILDADAATLEATFGGVRASAGMTAEAFNAVSQTTQFQMNQAMAQLKATLIDLGNQFLPIIKSVVDFMQANLKAFSSLPGPVKTVITVFAGMLAVVGPMLFIVGKLIVVFSGLLSVMLKMRAVGALRLAFAQLRGEMAATRASLKQTQTSIGMLATAANTAKVTVVASFRAIGTAAKGLLASLGPIGLAMLAVGAAFEIFVGKMAGTEHHLSNLRDEIDLTTGKMTEAAKVFIASELRHNISQEDLAMMENYGITISGFIAALEQGGPALDAYRDKMNAMLEAQKASEGIGGTGFLNVGTVNSINTIVENLDGMIGYYDQAKAAAADAAAAQVDGALAASDAQRGMMASYRATAQEQRAIAAGTASDGALIQNVMDKTAAAVRGLQTAFTELSDVVSDVRAADAAKDAYAALLAGIEENGKGFRRTTEEQRANRDNLLDYIDTQIAFAESLDEPQKQLKALQQLESDTKAALKKGGVKPNESAIYQSVRDAVDEAEKKVKGMKTAVQDAEKKGLDVAGAIAKGIEMGMSKEEATLDAAGTFAGDTTANGLNSALGIKSPSTVAMAAGRNTALGLIAGLRQMGTAAEGAGMNVGANVVRGMLTALRNGQGPVASAAREIVAAAIAAARDESEEGSPSRVFMRIGGNIGEGLRIGIARSAKPVSAAARSLVQQITQAVRAEFAGEMGPIQSAFADVLGGVMPLKEAERAVQDASWAVADARDRVREAEKALKKARKDGNAREVAAAERELARARRDAADATRLLNAAQSDLGMARFVAQNKEAFKALQKLAGQIDHIVERVGAARDAFAGLQELTDKPFGESSDIANAFGSSGSISSVISMFNDLEDAITAAYSVLTDPSIVGAASANLSKTEMNLVISQVRELTQESVDLRNEYEANEQAIVKLRDAFSRQIEAINSRYDTTVLPPLEAALRRTTEAYEKENATLERLTGERDAFLDRIQDGFRSFVNNFSAGAAAAVTTIEREVKTLANGVSITLEREIVGGGGAASIRQGLEERLAAVREFASNIRTLMERGLDPGIIKEFVAAGVDSSGGAVSALVKGSQGDLEAINQVQKDMAKEVKDFQDYASEQWSDTLIAQQDTLVSNAKRARDDAQNALDAAKSAREAELAAAKTAYDKQIKDLEDRNSAIKTRMDAIAKEVEAIITTLLSSLPDRSTAAGQAAINNLLAGFAASYPEVYRQLNGLMDLLADSLNRTATITVELQDLTGGLVGDGSAPGGGAGATPPSGGGGGTTQPKPPSGGGTTPGKVQNDLAKYLGKTDEIRGINNAERKEIEKAARELANKKGELGPKDRDKLAEMVQKAKGKALGGWVSRNMPYMVGERGPELFVPNAGGNIIPNNSIPFGAGAPRGDTVINVTVNAGVGTNGPEVGRVIVEEIKRFERTNGPVFVSAS